MNKVGMRKCPCGEPGCIKWHLTGMGNFYQGSGFTEDEAQLIVAALQGDAGELAYALIELMCLPGEASMTKAKAALLGTCKTPERRAFDILSQAWKDDYQEPRAGILLALQLMVRGQEREEQPGMADAGRCAGKQR